MLLLGDPRAPRSASSRRIGILSKLVVLRHQISFGGKLDHCRYVTLTLGAANRGLRTGGCTPTSSASFCNCIVHFDCLLAKSISLVGLPLAVMFADTTWSVIVLLPWVPTC